MLKRTTRPISWISAARKEFETFLDGAPAICLTDLIIAAEGGKADIAKPLKGLGLGVMETALPYRGNAFRVVYRCRSARSFGSCTRLKDRPGG